ncbi:MAG: sugar ABC transporter ATP-binding protein [Lentisphaeria bacterium]|nr:sugar ABC transporter ATP-binding protein [Lentisphaeria bacterium]
MVCMTGIRKRYPGVQALDGANLRVHSGEIRALLGENGAGKSTLMRMLTGAERPDSGSIAIAGRTVPRMTPGLADRFGIACVYQDLLLAEHLTVAENIWLGRLPARWGMMSRRELYRRTDRVLRDIGYHGIIRPADRVADLTASQQGMVAIVRALCRDARVIVFDEPTAVLADREVEELFRVIRLLRERDLAMIYISHRLEEVFALCDTATVLRDGMHVGDVRVAETRADDLIRMMVGREVSARHFDPGRTRGEEMLRAEGLCAGPLLDCSLTLHAGEIVGLYGLVGAGRTELTRVLFGGDPLRRGTVHLHGRPVQARSPRRAIDHGLGLIPEDRRRHGLALPLSVRDNLNLPVYRRDARWGWVSARKEAEVADRFIRELAIRTPSPRQRVRHLSGGNQQKVVVGKWLARGSRIFLMDEPTNGIDVGAKEEIYRLVNNLARGGAAILFVSSYMPELMDIADRILVMNGGRIVADVPRNACSEERLLRLAIRTPEGDPEPAATAAGQT